jgi:hypothetical protein
MSDVPEREQFRTRISCAKCEAQGHAVWEENSVLNPSGPMSRLVSLSDSFILQTSRKHQGQPVIACAACGTAQPD